MDDFIFDLQRFDNKIFPTLIAGNGVDELILTIGGQSTTINSNGITSINVSLNSDANDSLSAKDVAISLSASDEFTITDSTNKKRTYKMSKAGSNGGIVVSLDSSQKSTVDSIDKDDFFIVSDDSSISPTYSMTDKGLFVDYNSISNGYDGFVENSTLSSIVLTNTSLDSSTENFYKVIEVDDKNLIIDSADDFSKDGYNGVYAMDTDSTPSIYAKLISNNSVPYRISSVDSSATNSLSTIQFTDSANDVLKNKGVSFTNNFAGNAGSTPTIIAGQTTLHVDSTTDDLFTVSSGTDSAIALSGTNEISLIKGSIVANQSQSIKASPYTVSSYKGGTDGIVVYYDGTGNNATLGDVDPGESFVITDSTSAATTYTMTNFGLMKAGDTLPLSISSGSSYQRITDKTLSISLIANASPMSGYTDTFLNAKEIITLGGSSGEKYIAYWDNDNNNTNVPGALVTLKAGNNNTYTLSTNNNASELNLGKWGGISLSSNQSLVGDTIFANNVSQLNIMTGYATFGVASVSLIGDSYKNLTISGSNSGSVLPNFDYETSAGTKVGQKFTEINLVNGTLKTNSKNQGRQVVTLHGGKDIGFTLDSASETTFISNSDAESGGATINAKANSFTVGRGKIQQSGNATIVADTNGNTSIKKFTKSVTVSLDNNKSIWQPSVSGLAANDGVVLVYGKESGISVTGLNDGDIFRSTVKSGAVKTYQVVKNENENLVLLSYDGTTASNKDIQIFESAVDTEGVYDLNGQFNNNMSAQNSVIAISSENNFKDNETRSIIDITTVKSGSNTIVSAVSGDYGTLAKTLGADSSAYYVLNLNDEKTLSGITITDNAPVHFKKGDFTDTSINVANSYATFAFQNLDDSIGSDFKVSLNSDENYYNVSGASKISLISGSIVADSLSPEIWLSDSSSAYTISNDSLDTVGDGVAVGISVSGKTSNAIIGDIDIGESFKIGKTTYARQASPLNIMADGYSYVTSVVSGDMNDSTTAVAVKISDLTNANNKRKLIAAESVSSTKYGNDKMVLTLSSKTSENAIVANSTLTSAVAYAYADLSISGANYYLDTIEGANENWNADIISIMGGTASINSSVAKDKLIVAHVSNAAFKVNATSVDGGIFIVDGKNGGAQSIAGAKELTLVDGSIVAVPTIGNKNTSQVITLGDSKRTFQASVNSSNIYYNKDALTGVIKSSVGAGFKLDNKKDYSIISGDGMTFSVDGSSSITTANGLSGVTVTGFGQNEVLYYDSKYYSLMSAGLVRGDNKNTGNALWYKDKSYSINDSVAISDIVDSGNWLNIVPLTNNIATIPPSNFQTPAILTDSNYTATYGRLTRTTTNTYTLEKDDSDTLSISTVSVGPGNVTLNLDNDFDNITIKSPNDVIVAPTEFSTSDTYQFIQDSNVASLPGVKSASLLSGKLQADSNLAVTVSTASNTTAEAQALGDSNITLIAGSNAASVALDEGESLKVDGTNYTLGAIGLSNNNSILPSSKNTINIASITSPNAWFNTLKLDNKAITISSAITDDKTLVVDSIPNPTAQYASITTSGPGHFTVSTVGTDWSSDNTVFIKTTADDTVDVTFNKKSFQNKPIQTSNASFIVTTVKGADNNFVVTDYYSDSRTGASISNNTAVSLSSGNITTTNKAQTITAGDYSVIYAGGDGINVVYDNSVASLGALNKNDALKVGNTTYSLSSDSRIRKDGNKMWSKTVSSNGNALISDLVSDDNWKGIVTANNASLTIDSNSLKNNFTNSAAYIVDSVNSNTDDDVIYGTLTTLSGGLSMSTVDSNAENGLSNIKIDISGNNV